MRQAPVYSQEDREYSTPCWIWRGHINRRTGYGSRGKRLAHRLLYEAAKGPIPAGMDVDHLCRVRSCVNPDHLEPVTRGENIRRGRGTKLTDDAVRAIRRSRGPGKPVADLYGITRQYVYQLRSGTKARKGLEI